MASNPSDDTLSQQDDENSVLMIDPPSGWQFGFPKVFNPLPNESVEEFLIRNNYPVKDAAFAVKYCRYWRGDPCNEI